MNDQSINPLETVFDALVKYPEHVGNELVQI